MKFTVQEVSLCICFILHLWGTEAQTNAVDSLQKVLLIEKEDTGKVNTLIALCEILFQSGGMDSAMQYANNALSLAGKINFKGGIATAHQRLGWLYDDQNNFTQARKSYLSALKIREEIGDKQGIAYSLYSIAYTYVNQENEPEALKYYYAALKRFEALGDKEYIAEILNNIGSIYANQDNYQESLKNYFASLKIREAIGSKPGIAQTYNNIGSVYSIQGNFTLALKYTLAGLNIYKDIGDKGPNWGLAFNYSSLGEVYTKQGDAASLKKDKKTAAASYDEALNNFLKSQKLFGKINSKEGEAYANVCIGDLYRKQNKFSTAREYLKKGLQESAIPGYLEVAKIGYLSLSAIDSAQGNWQPAYAHYKTYILFRDSVFNADNTKKIALYQMQYEFDKKEALANAEREKQTILEQRNKNVQYFIMLSLLLLFLISGLIATLLYRNNRHKQKANNLLRRQKTEIDNQREKAEKALTELQSTQAQLIQSEKLASLGELTAGIAHEIQNPLNFVNNFSELSVDLAKELKAEMDKVEIPEKGKEYIVEIINDLAQNQQKINHHGKRAANIVTAMLQHSRTSTGTKEPTDLNALADEYLRLAYHGLRAKDPNFNAQIVTDFDPEIGEVVVIPQDMGRVLLNLVNNAFYAVHQRALIVGVQHARRPYEPTVTISTQKTDNQIIIKIKDNGTGIPDKVKDKIFQPFFTTKPAGQGTGLGLSLAYDIVVKGHSGNLEVDSKAGAGTTFVIHLPA